MCENFKYIDYTQNMNINDKIKFVSEVTLCITDRIFVDTKKKNC